MMPQPPHPGENKYDAEVMRQTVEGLLNATERLDTLWARLNAFDLLDINTAMPGNNIRQRMRILAMHQGDDPEEEDGFTPQWKIQTRQNPTSGLWEALVQTSYMLVTQGQMHSTFGVALGWTAFPNQSSYNAVLLNIGWVPRVPIMIVSTAVTDDNGDSSTPSFIPWIWSADSVSITLESSLSLGYGAKDVVSGDVTEKIEIGSVSLSTGVPVVTQLLEGTITVMSPIILGDGALSSGADAPDLSQMF